MLRLPLKELGFPLETNYSSKIAEKNAGITWEMTQCAKILSHQAQGGLRAESKKVIQDDKAVNIEKDLNACKEIYNKVGNFVLYSFVTFRN